jgi:hypothetical protein
MWIQSLNYTHSYHSLFIDDAQDFRETFPREIEKHQKQKGFLSPKIIIAKAKADHSKNAAQYTYCMIERDDSSSMHARKYCM